jgi:hypothetical protein
MNARKAEGSRALGLYSDLLNVYAYLGDRSLAQYFDLL